MSMTKEETKYTVFRDEGGLICFYCEYASSLDDFMRQVNVFYGGWLDKPSLIAWAAEPVSDHGGRLYCDDLCAESIAAGRLIELVDGVYVARGVPVEDKPAIPAPTDWVANARARVQKQRAADPNYEMIRRDGFALSKPAPVVVLKAAPKPTAKPSPFSRFRSPDLIASTHQADPRNGSAFLRD